MRYALYRQDVELAYAVRASRQHHDARTRLFLEVTHDGVVGYGEVAPQPVAQHGDPGWAEVLEATRSVLVRVEHLRAREGAPPSWRRVAGLSSGGAAENVACALVEMALLDWDLRLGREDLTALWPVRFDTPLQTTISLLDGAEWSIGSGVERVRAKLAPGNLDPTALERLAELRVPVIVDYNCSVENDDQVLAQVEELRALIDVAAVEQPYAPGNLVDHARLAARLNVPLGLDESVRQASDLRHIVRYGAATMICVKPARVGGLARARTMMELARELGLRSYLGGFFESPYARAVHRRFARTCAQEPSDLLDVMIGPGPEEVTRGAGGFGLEPSRSMLQRCEAFSPR